MVADAGVENVNREVARLIESGVLRRVLAQTELKFSNSMIEAWWRVLKHQWLYLNSLDSISTIRRLVTFYVQAHRSFPIRHSVDKRPMRCTSAGAITCQLNSSEHGLSHGGHGWKQTERGTVQRAQVKRNQRLPDQEGVVGGLPDDAPTIRWVDCPNPHRVGTKRLSTGGLNWPCTPGLGTQIDRT